MYRLTSYNLFYETYIYIAVWIFINIRLNSLSLCEKTCMLLLEFKPMHKNIPRMFFKRIYN